LAEIRAALVARVCSGLGLELACDESTGKGKMHVLKTPFSEFGVVHRGGRFSEDKREDIKSMSFQISGR